MKKDHESFLNPFFKQMNKMFPDRWCVLHSYENLPFFSQSDVDMAFSSPNIGALEILIKNIANNKEWTIYQRFWYDTEKCLYYVLKNDKDIFLALDFLVDNNGIGRYGFETSLLTYKCSTYHEFIKIPNNEIAFSYKFVKRIVKKRPLEEDQKYLFQHYNLSNHKRVSTILTNQFGLNGIKLIQKRLNKNSLLFTVDEVNFLIKEKRKIFIQKLKFINKIYWESRRVFNRIFYPCGIIINIAELQEDEMKIFLKLLTTKVGILFRYVLLNKSNSIKMNLKGIMGSSLVVCPVKNFNQDKAIKLHWLYSNYKGIVLKEHIDIEDLANQYYVLILDALLSRNRLKGKIQNG